MAMLQSAERPWRAQLLRFIAVGGANTLITLALFNLLVLVLPYLIAYSVTYAAGIVLSYAMNTRMVFKQAPSLASAARFPLVYVVQYAVGALLMWLLVDRMQWSASVALLAVIAITIPLTFALSRWALTAR